MIPLVMWRFTKKETTYKQLEERERGHANNSLEWIDLKTRRMGRKSYECSINARCS